MKILNYGIMELWNYYRIDKKKKKLFYENRFRQ